ncbi:hypothetical protein [Streptomyces sp. NPDC008121]|uniref:hypothetical protein n=1 Tax=Streptomyces sp. NPDC008121 TaxID=3364809 RepID=UPI0036E09B88
MKSAVKHAAVFAAGAALATGGIFSGTAYAADASGTQAAGNLEAASNPQQSCRESEDRLTCNVKHTMAWGSWQDVDFYCPESLPWVKVDAPDLFERVKGIVYGPYDNGPDDGGHFWLRLNAFPSDVFDFTYHCAGSQT